MRQGVRGEEKGKEFLIVLKVHYHSIIHMTHLELFCVYVWGKRVCGMECYPSFCCYNKIPDTDYL